MVSEWPMLAPTAHVVARSCRKFEKHCLTPLILPCRTNLTANGLNPDFMSISVFVFKHNCFISLISRRLEF
jgi:hypothetical protein